MADPNDLDEWIAAELARCKLIPGTNYHYDYNRALTLLQEHRAALRAAEHEPRGVTMDSKVVRCLCPRCVAIRAVLAEKP